MKADAKEATRKRLQAQRAQRALECAKGKKGDCREMDNKPIVCKVCKRLGFCEELRQRPIQRRGDA